MTKQQFAIFDIDGTLFQSGPYCEVFDELGKEPRHERCILEKTDQQ